MAFDAGHYKKVEREVYSMTAASYENTVERPFRRMHRGYWTGLD